MFKNEKEMDKIIRDLIISTSTTLSKEQISDLESIEETEIKVENIDDIMVKMYPDYKKNIDYEKNSRKEKY